MARTSSKFVTTAALLNSGRYITSLPYLCVGENDHGDEQAGHTGPRSPAPWSPGQVASKPNPESRRHILPHLITGRFCATLL